ncbi:MAG TPA: phosphoadenylyl-sulfate reductase, partial [Polyangia bacterium]
MKPTEAEIAAATTELQSASAPDVLRWGMGRFGDQLAIASSFSLEDNVVTDIAHKLNPKVRVFALDTGRLPEETYQTADRVRDKYGIEIEWLFPDRVAVEALLRKKGPYSFMDSLDNRHECCGIRKVEPLGRILSTLSGWVTGLRREQSVTRSETATVEFDRGHGGIAKLNPIIAWTNEELWAYADAQRVPVHPLHRKGYPSIGCAPCTRAVQPGEHPRAGRWWWENPESKE